MIDIGQAVVTAALGAGGYWGLRLFAEPIMEQRKVRARIAHALVYYANATSVPGLLGVDAAEARTAIRKLAADLREGRIAIPCYRTLEKMRLVMSRRALIDVSAELIGWSNSLHTENAERFERRRRIAKLLEIPDDIDANTGTRDIRQNSSTQPAEAEAVA